MVMVDSTASPVVEKRRGEGAARRNKIRNQLRSKSTNMVKTGQVDLTPCLICGSQQDLTIHHVEPIQPDRFVFLCEPCHILAHRPTFRTIKVCVASGHFSVRPEAVLPKKDVPGG